MTAGDLNEAFRGEVYGERPAMTEQAFREHVERNDVDLARSRRWTVDGALSGMVLLAFRGERAWIGGFGVVPACRGRGLGRRYLDEALAVARASGATTVELEVLVQNAAAIRLYERAGFEVVDELVVWEGEPLRAPAATDPAPRTRAFDAAAIASLSRSPAPCWQREPRSAAAASPFEAIFVGAPESPGAYAFVRRTERMSVVDARAHDAASAAALLAALDAQAGTAVLALVNEPARGALHDALASHGRWCAFARQHRMRAPLR